MPEEAPWQDQAYDLLRAANVTQFAYVPDAGHRTLIDRALADPDVHAIPLATEQEGVALAAGADLGGSRAVLLMQSSGVGNCINMLGTIRECRFPLLTLVTMRGEWGEFNPWQLPMGQGTPKALENAGVVVQHVNERALVGETVYAAAMMAFQTNRAVAVLIGQRVVGFKDWSK
jgi:sulfopyruvate decarboxylase TPP-binding subunit